jgi:hypothetical protein
MSIQRAKRTRTNRCVTTLTRIGTDFLSDDAFVFGAPYACGRRVRGVSVAKRRAGHKW